MDQQEVTFAITKNPCEHYFLNIDPVLVGHEVFFITVVDIIIIVVKSSANGSTK